ncbi:MAG: hypothetical protein J5723_03825 [Ruminococcus sp.]|nr:hypothetical protein [Ruminococcus sp.]
MKITKAILRLAAAEVLSLFINMIFAGSGSSFIRLICVICTVMILAAVMADYSIRAANNDVKKYKNIRYKALIYSAASVTAFPLFSWMILLFSANSGAFNYYGAHKLLNAPFLNFYNLIEPSASVSKLGTAEIMAMLPPAFAPAAFLVIVYIAAFRKHVNVY